jgi:uncharacterized protein (UPF0335 family)
MTAPAVKDEAAAHRFAKDHLKSFVERVERLEEEKKALSDDIRDVFSEAKANGFDVKALRSVIRLRKQDVDERAEQEAILETYLAALGMLVDAAVRTAEVHVRHARAQACEFASDAVIRTTRSAPPARACAGLSEKAAVDTPAAAATSPSPPAEELGGDDQPRPEPNPTTPRLGIPGGAINPADIPFPDCLRRGPDNRSPFLPPKGEPPPSTGPP